MKRYILVLFCLFAAVSVSVAASSYASVSVAADSAVVSGVVDDSISAHVAVSDVATDDELWDQAGKAYMSGNYGVAVAAYTAILERGVHSFKLYYNLGNAYFKQDMLGGAILNYNRALLLRPADADARYNLALASSKVTDRIASVPEFFVKTWLRNLGRVMSSDGWTVVVLCALALVAVFVLVWLFAPGVAWRRSGFYGACFAVLLLGGSLYYAQSGYAQLTDGERAVVMMNSVPVKSSPAQSGKDLFVLHQGTVVTSGELLDGWIQVTLSDGNVGWIESRNIEKI